MDPVKTDDDYIKGDLKKDTVTYSNGVVSFVSGNALADKYTIYLIAAADTGINENDNDYTVDTVTGSGLETECKGYTVTGTYYGVLNDDGEITSLYVYVSGASAVRA